MLSCFSIPLFSRFPRPIVNDIKPPGENWPQAFYKRHPELIAMRMKAIDWDRHDRHIYNKVIDWFTVIGKELASPAVLAENIAPDISLASVHDSWYIRLE